MNLRLPAIAILIATLFLLTAPAPAAARVIELQRHENRANSTSPFSTRPVGNWSLDAGGDLRARTIGTPAGGLEAQCSVIVKRSNAAEARQGRSTQVFLAPPTAAEITDMLGGEVPDLEVLAVSAVTLHTRARPTRPPCATPWSPRSARPGPTAGWC